MRRASEQCPTVAVGGRPDELCTATAPLRAWRSEFGCVAALESRIVLTSLVGAICGYAGSIVVAPSPVRTPHAVGASHLVERTLRRWFVTVNADKHRGCLPRPTASLQMILGNRAAAALAMLSPSTESLSQQQSIF